MIDPTSREAFEIEQRRRQDGAVVVSVLGDLDLASCPQLAETLDGIVAQERAAILDLSGVTFMDSTGLNLLLQLTRRSRREGWTFAILPELPDTIVQLLEITQTRVHLPFDDGP